MAPIEPSLLATPMCRCVFVRSGPAPRVEHHRLAQLVFPRLHNTNSYCSLQRSGFGFNFSARLAEGFCQNAAMMATQIRPEGFNGLGTGRHEGGEDNTSASALASIGWNTESTPANL